jgi:transposase
MLQFWGTTGLNIRWRSIAVVEVMVTNDYLPRKERGNPRGFEVSWFPLEPITRLRSALPLILEDESNRLSALMRELLGEMAERLRLLDDCLRQYDQRIARVCEGVGPLVATAIVAAIGNPQQFTNGRELGAWLGLVPREHSSGNRTMLLGISKRGNRYLRTLLIHGACAATRVAERKRDARSIWLSRLKLRGGPNVAAVALANKNARVMWALLARGDSYRVRTDRAAAA